MKLNRNKLHMVSVILGVIGLLLHFIDKDDNAALFMVRLTVVGLTVYFVTDEEEKEQS